MKNKNSKANPQAQMAVRCSALVRPHGLPGNALLVALDNHAIEKSNTTRSRAAHDAELLDQRAANLLPIPASHRGLQFAHGASSGLTIKLTDRHKLTYESEKLQ